MTQPSPTIAATDLTKRFPGLVAVDRLSLEVVPGEIFGLVGPDGAGKTTTLRMLAGILLPDEGAAVVAGCDITRDAEAAKHRLSYMPQRFGLYEDLTVDENIRFYADLFGVPGANRRERSQRLLEAAGMAEFRRRLAGHLSGGMKQKLGLVCALIHTPEVILLDEPTTGVDPISRRDFWSILYSLVGQGVSILTSTAYLDEAERCHRVALLHEGRLLFCDTPSRLKERLPGAVVAVRSAEPRRLREPVESMAGVASIVLVGDGLHVVVDDAERRIPQLNQQLTTAGLPFDEITQVTPSIEDLFVSAVQAEAGGRPA